MKKITDSLTEKTKNFSIEQTLDFLAKEYPNKIVFSTSFGKEDQVLTDIISKTKLPIGLFTLDTGRLFQETYDVFHKTLKKYNVKIETHFPETEEVEKLINKKGPNSFYDSVENRKECCFIRKVAPLNRALQDKQIWITGLRAEQSENRNNLTLFQYDSSFDIIKYNPLLKWTLADIQNYIDKESVPQNALHQKGFESIGCAPCTRAILPGEDIRAGRWSWESSHKECGLHAPMSKNTK